MASEKKYTEREVVLMKRKGFKSGALWAATRCNPMSTLDGEIDRENRVRYPLPRITRPRVWVGPNGNTRFQVVDGVLLGKDFEEDEEWLPVDSYSFNVTPERAVAWADLYANPTEEVDDDDA